MRGFKWILLVIIICMPLLAACSDASTYDSVSADIMEQLANDEISEAGGFFSTERYLNWCNQVKWYSVPVLIVSVLIGIGMMVIFRNARKLWKTGLFGFVIGIPAIIIVTVYVMCFLYGKFF